MRRIHLLFMILPALLNNQVSAQSTYQAYFLQGYHDDYYSRFQRAANGDILLLFQKFIYDGWSGKDSGIIVTRRNATGNAIWSKNYSQPFFDENSISYYGTVLLATKDNGFILVTTIQKSDTTSSNVTYSYFIIKCNSSGNIIWKELLKAPFKYRSSNHSLNICEASDESVYLVPHDLHDYFHVIKLRKNGVLSWAKTYPSGGTIFNFITSVIADKYNNLIIAMSKAGCEGYCGSSYIQKIGKNGNTIWGGNTLLYDINSDDPILITYGNNRIEIILRITLDNYSTRLVCWSLSDDKSDSKAVMIKDDIFSLKYFLKTNHFESAKNKIIEFDNNSDVYIINDDWSLLQIQREYGFPSDTIYFREYDSLDRICPDFQLPKFSRTTKRVEIPTDSFHYADVPYVINMADFNTTISDYTLPITYTCSGSAPLAATTKQNNIATSLKPTVTFYPNPATNALTVSGLNNKNKTTLQIINTNGAILKEATTTSSTYNLDIHSLAAGAYLLCVNNGEEMITKTFIKQ